MVHRCDCQKAMNGEDRDFIGVVKGYSDAAWNTVQLIVRSPDMLGWGKLCRNWLLISIYNHDIPYTSPSRRYLRCWGKNTHTVPMTAITEHTTMRNQSKTFSASLISWEKSFR